MTSTTTSISKQTFNILKNFSSINSNLFVKAGNKISTISPSKNVMAEAIVDETFDSQFGVWDLNKFLGIVSLLEDPEFMFEEKCVVVTGVNGSSVKYYFADPALLTYPTKQVKTPSVAITFDLMADQFRELQRSGAALQLSDLCIVSKGTEVLAVVKDIKDPTTNVFTLPVGSNPEEATFSFNFKLDNLKLFEGDYSVEISKTVISQFTHKNLDLKYWIAMENTSTYSE